MISLVIAAIILIITVIAVIACMASDEQLPTVAIGVTGTVIAGLVVLASCFAQVPTKSVGVPTNFSKPTGDTFGAGIQFIAPWTKVVDVDGRKQQKKWNGDSCISVQIADGGTACAWVSYEWQLKTDKADIAYQDYGKEDDIIQAVYDAVVSINAKAALVEVFGDYDALADLPALTSDMDPDKLANATVAIAPDYPALSTQIKTLAQEKVDEAGGLVEFTQLKFTKLELPEATQKKINAFNAAVGETRIALQDRATKAAEAAGNEELTETLTPEILQSKCLDLVATAVEEKYPLNAAFNCLGSNAGLLVGNTSNK